MLDYLTIFSLIYKICLNINIMSYHDNKYVVCDLSKGACACVFMYICMGRGKSMCMWLHLRVWCFYVSLWHECVYVWLCIRVSHVYECICICVVGIWVYLNVWEYMCLYLWVSVVRGIVTICKSTQVYVWEWMHMRGCVSVYVRMCESVCECICECGWEGMYA